MNEQHPIEFSDSDHTLANYLCTYPIQHSAPIYFGNPRRTDSKVNNGTASLLKKGNKRFIVTNHHVFAGFLKRKTADTGVTICIGGLCLESIEERVVFNDEQMDVCVLDFSDHVEADFLMAGDVDTQFHELGQIQPLMSEKIVAFGGYPGVSRVQVAQNELHFHTFSSGASVVEDLSDRRIVVSIDHRDSRITKLNTIGPPSDIGGLSGGPVFAVGVGEIITLRFAGIIAECNENLRVMFAIPVGQFGTAFS